MLYAHTAESPMGPLPCCGHSPAGHASPGVSLLELLDHTVIAGSAVSGAVDSRHASLALGLQCTHQAMWPLQSFPGSLHKHLVLEPLQWRCEAFKTPAVQQHCRTR